MKSSDSVKGDVTVTETVQVTMLVVLKRWWVRVRAETIQKLVTSFIGVAKRSELDKRVVVVKITF